MLCKCCVALSAYMCHSCATSRRTVRYDTCYATAVLRYQYICIIVARQQVGQYGMIHVMQMLCCLRTDRLEENGNGVPGLELPAPELKNLAQIAKVDCCQHCCGPFIILLAQREFMDCCEYCCSRCIILLARLPTKRT